MEDVRSKIFVGGLAAVTTNESLMAYFASFSPIEATVQMDRITGRSRGFGFVIFPTVELAQAVLSMPHVVDGKAVECKACVSKQDAREGGMVATRGPGGMMNAGGMQGGGCFRNPVPSAPSFQASGGGYEQGCGGGSPPARPVANKLFIGGLAPTTTSESMSAYFSQFGQADCVVMMDRYTGRSRGFGFVTYTTQDAVQAALLNGTNTTGTQSEHVVDGKVVSARICEDRDRGFGGGACFGGGFGGGCGGGCCGCAGGGGCFGAQSYQQQQQQPQLALPPPGGAVSSGPPSPLSTAMQALSSALSGTANPGATAGTSSLALAPSLGGPPAHVATQNRVFVGGLPQTCDDAKLHTFFSQFGPLTDAKVMFDRSTGRSRGFGYVSFLEIAGMEAALSNVGNNMIDDKRIEVKRCEERGSPALQGRERGPAQGGGPIPLLGGGADAIGTAIAALAQLQQPQQPQVVLPPPTQTLQSLLPLQAAGAQPDAVSALAQLSGLLSNPALLAPVAAPAPAAAVPDAASALAQLSGLLGGLPGVAPAAPPPPPPGGDLLSQVSKMLQDPTAIVNAILQPMVQQLAGGSSSQPASTGPALPDRSTGGGLRYAPY